MAESSRGKNFILVSIFLAGFLLLPAFSLRAQLPPGTSLEQVEAALRELATAVGQEITSVEKAVQVCDQEKYLTLCAEIGQKHGLYQPEEKKQVEIILAELKGQVIEELTLCTDPRCLLAAAESLADKILAKAPDLAKDLDLLPEKIKEKEKILATVEGVAQEIGVSFKECREIDPEVAPLELLRACARLARDSRVEIYLPAPIRKKAELLDPLIELRKALAEGEYQCGNNTAEGCGRFCLNPPAEVRSQGVEGIPQVCRQIAERFFGSEGVEALEVAYRQVGEVVNYYDRALENLVFTTEDGRELYRPEEIGRYLEEKGREGNVEAVRAGMDFMIAQGFAAVEDKDFVLKMVARAREKGGLPDFNKCREDPRACREFIPPEFEEEFLVLERAEQVISSQMNQEGLPDPSFCESPEYQEKCLLASKRAIDELETLLLEFPRPQLQQMIEEIRNHTRRGERGVIARERAEKKFAEQGKILMGEKEFQSLEEMEAFCRANPALCLAGAAEQGLIEKEDARERFERSLEKQFRVPPAEFAPPLFPGQGPFPGFEPPGFEGVPPGQLPGFTAPGPGFQLPPGREKEELLKKFEAWLERPEGAPPVPDFDRPRHFPEPFLKSEPFFRSVPRPELLPPSSRPELRACVIPTLEPCPEGFYRLKQRGPDGCPIFGECQPISDQEKRPDLECRPTGCSKEICADQELISACQYRPEYDCYRKTRCERQSEGGCGWVETPEFQECLFSVRCLEEQGQWDSVTSTCKKPSPDPAIECGRQGGKWHPETMICEMPAGTFRPELLLASVRETLLYLFNR